MVAAVAVDKSAYMTWSATPSAASFINNLLLEASSDGIL
jgi:hypothetical protein